MTERNQTPITTTTGTGVANAKFDCVTFTVLAQMNAKTGPEAKKALEPVVANLKRAIAGFETLGVSKVAERPNLVRPQVWDQKKSRNVPGAEWVATHAVTFQIAAIDKAAEVYNTLSEIGDIQVGTPEPKLEHENLIRLQDTAREDAMKRIIDRARSERDTIFGNKASEIGFHVVSYQPSYDDSLSAGRTPHARPAAMRAMSMESAGGGGGEPAEPLDFGEAQVTCRLNVVWGICTRSESRIDS